MRNGLFTLLLVVLLATTVSADPILNSIGTQQVNEGQTLSFTVSNSVPDNGSTTYTLDGNAPISGVSTATIGSNAATLTRNSDVLASFAWTAPSVSADTIFNVVFAAADADSSDDETVVITVKNTGDGIALSDLVLGDDDQERSNPQLDDDENGYYAEASASFTIKNNEATAVSNVQVMWPSAAKYNMTLVSISGATGSATSDGVAFASIAAGQTVTVTVSARVPEDLPAINLDASNPQDDRAILIGSLSLTANGGLSATSDVTMEAENMLVIDNLEVSFEGDSASYDEGDDIENVEPGFKVTFDLRAENRFRDSDDIQIENVEFQLVIDEGDLDEDENEDLKDLDPRDDDTATISIDLDDDIEEDDYTVEITLTGEDENGALHGEVWELTLVVEKEKENIAIKRIDLSPQSISLCEGEPNSARLRVDIENKGSDDSDEIVLVVTNEKLNFFGRVLNIDLDENDDFDRTFTVDVPSSTKAGTYQLDVWTYFDFDEYDDESPNAYGSVDLRVTACPVSVEDDDKDTAEDTKDDTVVVVDDKDTEEQKPSDSGTVIAIPVVEDKDETTTSGSGNTYVALMILAYIIVIAVIVILIIRLLKK
ncbi:hypothetical protein H6504_05455 [Candidatus Woesearchaeota archaeon]|nr:hypothetical protein [Candidatus Woesearchaeota archaeon]